MSRMLVSNPRVLILRNSRRVFAGVGVCASWRPRQRRATADYAMRWLHSFCGAKLTVTAVKSSSALPALCRVATDGSNKNRSV
ncbi:MAG: hypothetical protein M2R45_04961 [Verrucomicrobia subdivision 3 bacterium]|nr:hypothetical protein [Limisphaerales bacterium]MCS1414092.1 hypothetical protein [Limisphaerales bacterium]